MAGENDQDWAPKTRDDWAGLFKDAFKGAQSEIQSEREEAEAKAAADAAASSDDKTGNSGGSDANAGKQRKSFADRLLGS